MFNKSDFVPIVSDPFLVFSKNPKKRRKFVKVLRFSPQKIWYYTNYERSIFGDFVFSKKSKTSGVFALKKKKTQKIGICTIHELSIFGVFENSGNRSKFVTFLPFMRDPISVIWCFRKSQKNMQFDSIFLYFTIKKMGWKNKIYLKIKWILYQSWVIYF